MSANAITCVDDMFPVNEPVFSHGFSRADIEMFSRHRATHGSSVSSSESGSRKASASTVPGDTAAAAAAAAAAVKVDTSGGVHSHSTIMTMAPRQQQQQQQQQQQHQHFGNSMGYIGGVGMGGAGGYPLAPHMMARGNATVPVLGGGGAGYGRAQNIATTGAYGRR
eukprot:UC1_evm2s83